ncbi:MAG: hypothetical protein Q7S22_03930 [Candidatus Micrarchaeota archaeon]|nr:hypothetical protein [Candidatus Micrarchaeota archaeon]
MILMFQDNAYLLERTMKNYNELKSELTTSGFTFIIKKNGLKITVTLENLDIFSRIIMKHINNNFNYVDIQFTSLTALITNDKLFLIRTKEENDNAKKELIARGLSEKEAGWKTSFDQK